MTMIPKQTPWEVKAPSWKTWGKFVAACLADCVVNTFMYAAAMYLLLMYDINIMSWPLWIGILMSSHTLWVRREAANSPSLAESEEGEEVSKKDHEAYLKLLEDHIEVASKVKEYQVLASQYTRSTGVFLEKWRNAVRREADLKRQVQFLERELGQMRGVPRDSATSSSATITLAEVKR